MTMIGMNIQEVRNLASQLSSAAGQIDTLIGQLGGQLSGTTWVGADRTRFEGDWNSTHVSNLRTVAEALRGAATAASNNANEQEQVSS